MKTVAIASLLTAALAACAGPAPHRPPPGGRFEGSPGPRLFISPAGEPFRPSGPGAADPMKVWFDGCDKDGDGIVTLAEFTADHRRFFAVLDQNGDGAISPTEISRYEDKIAPEIQGDVFGGRSAGRGPGEGGGQRGGVPSGSGGGHGDGPGGDMRGGRRGGFAAGRNGLQGAARFGLLDQPEPVSDADQNVDFQVTAAEWDAAAQRRFAVLDVNHDGALTFDELTPLGRSGRDRSR